MQASKQETNQAVAQSKAKDTLEEKNGLIATYDTHTQAEAAVKELQRAGFNMKKLSIIGRDFQTEENIVGFYNTGDRVKYWGKLGAFWGGLWSLLFGSAFFLIPGLGPVVVAGTFASTLVAAMEGAVVMGGLSALGAALYSIGIPRDSVVQYEAALKAGKYVMVAHGTAADIDRAKEISANMGANTTADFEIKGMKSGSKIMQ